MIIKVIYSLNPAGLNNFTGKDWEQEKFDSCEVEPLTLILFSINELSRNIAGKFLITMAYR